MKQLPGPTPNEVTAGNLPSEGRREIIGNRIDLPGRFPIYTDGMMFDMVKELSYLLGQQDHEDKSNISRISGMIERLLKHTRTNLKKDGRKLSDWKCTVMVTVHHKGQATDFWFGDGPEKEVRVDQSLDEKLRKPIEAERVKIQKL